MKFGRRCNYRSCTLQCLVYFGQPPSQMEFATDTIFPKPGESTVFEGGRETIVAERLSDWRLPDLGRHRFGALGCRLGRGWDPSRCASQVCCLREGFVAASGFWTAFPKVCCWLLGKLVKASRSELEHGQEMSVVSTYNSQHTLQKP